MTQVFFLSFLPSPSLFLFFCLVHLGCVSWWLRIITSVSHHRKDCSSLVFDFIFYFFPPYLRWSSIFIWCLYVYVFHCSAITGVYQDVSSKSFLSRMRGWVDRCAFDYQVWKENVTFGMTSWFIRTYIRILSWIGRAPDISKFETLQKSTEKR